MAVSDQRQDLVPEGVDVALRLGKLPDSTATSRRLGQWCSLMLAPPSYLERMGTPSQAEELARHQIIAGPTNAAGGWCFRQGDRHTTVKLKVCLPLDLMAVDGDQDF